ncbi:MAG: RICIN domain-containing protein [Ruminococcus sp.]|nr:RICIN domain-containing protein [Ruminococcus sp.]
MGNKIKKQLSIIMSLLLVLGFVLPFGFSSDLRALAVSADHPAQLMNIVTKDGSKALKENGTSDGSALSVAELGGDLSPAWRFDRVDQDSNGTFFKIVNAQSGRLLTPQNYNASSGARVIVYGSESAKSQHWYVIPVSTDRLGNSLYYKIVNYADTSLALTQSSGGISLSTYTGADSQLWLLNCDGLQGFAGYCSDDATGKIKAGNIGGLFGETVEASTFDELKKYATSDTPYTIIVTKNISVTELNMNGERYMCSAGRIYVHNNKTIIGSYSAHTLFNVQFCTSSKLGTGNNIIIKNFDMQHDAESNNNDSIVCYFGSGENIWVDHVTFTGHNGYGYAPKTGKVDEDKFLACCYDADYCTVSDCSFGAHKYGLILGYPADGANEKAKYDNFPRMSLISNKFSDTNTRGPGLMRWGYYHSLNNYVNKFSMAYTVISNCKIYAENCVYENGGNVICDWDKMTYAGSYSESGSVFSNCKRTKQGGDSNSTATACSWRPSSNYRYTALTANDAKNYCNAYSGCQKDKGNIMYLRYSSKGVPSAGYSEAPSGPSAAEFTDGSLYMIKNVNSGLYMEVTGGAAKSGTNVQQWGQDGARRHNTWKLVSAGDGYYYIYSCLGDMGAFALGLAEEKAVNGVNIGIYDLSGSKAQQFMFTSNGDGSYKIRTRASAENSAVEIKDAGTSSGDNVQQWEINGASCQDWVLEPAVLPIDGALARELRVSDTANSAAWNISANAAVGDKVYGDRDFTFTELPEMLIGSERIITACDSKNTDSELAAFTAAEGVTVYVAVDERVTNTPAWLTGYSAADEKITASNGVTYSVFALEAEQGKSIVLGTNGQSSGCVNYSVFVQKKAEKVKGDVNADGELSVADLVLVQKWLLAVPETELADWQAGDLCEDGRLDTFDLCLMRSSLVANQ